MPDEFTVLLDAPGDATSRIPLARLGDYKDRRYGDFSITKDDVVAWQTNLAKLPGARALIDEDHLANKPSPHRNTKASGWITGIQLGEDGKQVYGDVEWTPKGKAAIDNKEYLFTSPTFGPYTNDKGERFENTLTGAALTNKPFLTSMPQVTLASDEAISRALEDDPAAALFQRALDGEFGGDVQAIALAQPSSEDADVTAALSAASAAVAKALRAQGADPDKGDPNDRSVLRALRSAASSLDDAEAAQARDNKGEKPVSMFEIDDTGAVITLDTLTTEARNNLKDSDFALPGRRYPIHDLAHARNALARVAQNGSPDEQAKVRAAVYRKYPQLKTSAKTLDATDRRGQMFTEDTIKSLASIAGITDEAKINEIVALATGDDADEAKVLEAIEAAKPEPVAAKTLEELAEEQGVKVLTTDEHTQLTNEAKEAADAKRQLQANADGTKTLEQLAEESGKVLLDSEQVTTLEEAAGKVPGLELAVKKLDDDAKASAKELSDNRFEQAYDKAEGDGKAVPAQKDRWKAFYELDAEGTITMLEEQPQQVNTKPRGRNVPAPADNVPDGQHPEHHELEQQIQAHMTENNVDYFTALDAVANVKIPGMAGSA